LKNPVEIPKIFPEDGTGKNSVENPPDMAHPVNGGIE